MLLNPSKYLFLSTLIFGTLISISANSWFGIWMGLEINLLSFIPLMSNSQNKLSSEASLKYFLIQALASSILLFATILLHLNNSIIYMNHIILTLISLSLLLKMGAAPLHFWFPGTMEGLNWMNCFILMTWQKIAPLILLSYIFPFSSYMMPFTISCIIIGSFGGLNQTSLRKLLAYSSINHLGWMLAALMTGENMWMIYFLIYSFLSLAIIYMFHTFQIFHINQTFLMLSNNPLLKFILFSLLLSLGGLPPFMGFLPKWLVIQMMIHNHLLFLTTLMVITTLMTLFYYLRLSFTSFLLSYSEIKWNKSSHMNYTTSIPLMFMSFISISGLMICMMIFI
uniref:NADH-ubiquinone oxidoreductase chain 2 n=1 Tax=Ruidocollaris convexipennis TaxID=2708008 RepID=A0A6G6A7J5_9ORTH|nr:NADH dehydrogenase subunit 2 [Ruidocollaris convexipennis]QID03772.1 NADH dehydrogenase subunit 2 [Ruidocollaris convexipennis]